MTNLICRLFGHKKLQAMECEPHPDGLCALWWCERCPEAKYVTIKEWYKINNGT